VARVLFAPGVFDELDPIVSHLQQHEVDAAEAGVAGIVSALDALADNPLIGQRAGNELREPVIGRGAHAYGALYRYLQVLDTLWCWRSAGSSGAATHGRERHHKALTSSTSSRRSLRRRPLRCSSKHSPLRQLRSSPGRPARA
jgi:toxin ParE1/3/4